MSDSKYPVCTQGQSKRNTYIQNEMKTISEQTRCSIRYVLFTWLWFIFEDKQVSYAVNVFYKCKSALQIAWFLKKLVFGQNHKNCCKREVNLYVTTGINIRTELVLTCRMVEMDQWGCKKQNLNANLWCNIFLS